MPRVFSNSGHTMKKSELTRMEQEQKIERFVNDILTISAVGSEGGEQAVRQALYHLLTAVSMYELMDGDERQLVDAMTKKVQYFFCTKFALKERKRNKEKKNFPPNPLLKEQVKKEKVEKTLSLAGGADLEFQRRLEAFHAECLKRVGTYDVAMLSDFYNFYNQRNQVTGKMRFEEEKYWDLDSRLKRWVRNKYSSENTAAALRLKRTKKQADESAAVAQQAAERERADAAREEQSRQARAGQMLTEEYVRQHPDGIMARIYRRRKT